MTWIDHETVWEHNMHPSVHARYCYDYVERRAKEFLEQFKGAKFSTIMLVEALYSGDNDQTDQRIFAALKALSVRGMAGFWTHGPDGRKIWRAP